MKNDYTNNKLKELLDKLQQESWQLELLISGFAIFGLFAAITPLKVSMNEAIIIEDEAKLIFTIITYASCYILIFNLLLHVVLRGLWIGALGLRYVSGNIDFEKLNYNLKFTKYLKKKIVSFDKYVATLENYCSILFAISFLLIFYLISFFIILFVIGIIDNLVIDNDSLPELIRNILGYSLLTFVGIGAFFTLIDFFTQGFLKKKKILAKIYFPFYWVFTYFTLSFLYRPLVYNFLDNKFGKRLSLLLVPIYVFILFLSTFENIRSNYLSEKLSNNSISINNDNYDSMLKEEYHFVKNSTIQSKVITENYLKVFCVFNNKVENNIFNYYPELKPENDDRVYTTRVSFSKKSSVTKNKDSLSKKYLQVFNEIHQLYIDSVKYNSDFLITKNFKN
jgi:hypothetical protein